MTEHTSEHHLAEPLIEWLLALGRIRDDTIIAHEFRWFGRNVDLVTLTVSGSLTSYELKLRNNRRAVQQAAYNRLAFDRSFIVTASMPKIENIQHAQEAGVGVILVNGRGPLVVCEPKAGAEIAALRQQLAEAVRCRAAGYVFEAV